MNPTRIAGLLVSWAALGGPLTAQDADDAFARAAAAFGLPASALREAHVDPVRLPALDVVVTHVKAVDRDGRVLVIDLDATGRPVDLAGLRAVEQALIAAEPRLKIDERLGDRLAAAGAGERVPVAVWITLETRELDAFARERLAGIEADTPKADVRAAEAEVDAFVTSRVTQRVAAFEAALSADGLQLRARSHTAPLVFMDLDADEALRVAARTDVRALMSDASDAQDANEDASASHKTDRVKWKGVKGEGIRVAMLEDNGILAACPFLDVVDWYSDTYNPDEHIHGTSGCVASTKHDREGAAPAVDLYSANADSYDNDDLIDAADWIAGRQVDITNMSFGGNCAGGFNVLDHYFDYASRHLRDSYVAAAGNTSSCPTLWVESPGKAYNVIAVGSFANAGTGDWSDDAMSSFSCSQNPTVGLEKPNIVANGEDVDTLGYPSPWEHDSYDGTSFASPHAAGNLADCMQINSRIMIYPEAAMALLMATAWHNIEGDPLLSHKDGAGAIDGWAAYRCAKDGRVDGEYLDEGSFGSGGYYTYPILLEGGQLTRVCVAWSAEGYDILGTYVSGLTTDLDIRVITNPFGMVSEVLATSSSAVNNFELCSFTPDYDGWYGVQISCNGTITGSDSQPYGIAWTQSGDMNLVSLGEVFVPAPTIDGLYPLGPTAGSDGFHLVHEGPFANATHVVLPTGTPGGGFTAVEGGGVWAPFLPDVFTDIWLQTAALGFPWMGTLGVTSPEGVADGIGLFLPGNPGLVGKPLLHTTLLLDEQFGVIGASLPHDATILPKPTKLPDGDVVHVALPFPVPFYGTPQTDLYVSEDGYVTFAQPDDTPVQDPAALLAGPPRIAVRWHDMEREAPMASLQHRVVTTGRRQVVVEWVRMDEGGQPDTMRLVLHDDGLIELGYGACVAGAALVGLAPGAGQGGATALDLTASGERLGTQLEAVYEVFDDVVNPFDLGASLVPGTTTRVWNTLRFVPADAQGATYRLDMTVR